MRKLKRLMACVLSAVVLSTSTAVMPTTTFAETTADTSFTMTEEDAYYSDPANLIWDDGKRRYYSDGLIMFVNSTKYGVILQHSKNTVLTDELLGLPAGYSVTTYDVAVEDSADDTVSVVETVTYEEAEDISRLANKWLDDGLVSKASIMTVVDYNCVEDYALKVRLWDPEDPVDLTVYGFPAENITDCGDGVYLCTLTAEQLLDPKSDENLSFEIIESDKVQSVGPCYGLCDVPHRYLNLEPVVPADAERETSFTMSENAAYLSDPANIAWEKDNVRCYKDGQIINIECIEYGVLLQHNKYTELTDELLGLPVGYSVEDDCLAWMEAYGNNKLSSIPTETYEEAAEISKLANAWLADGLVSKASIITAVGHGCGGVSLEVELNDPANVNIDLMEFGFSSVYYRGDAKYECGFTAEQKQDLSCIESMKAALENDSRIKSVEEKWVFCAVAHHFNTFDPILPVDPPTYTLEELYNMSDEEFLALDGAQDMYTEIENDVNSVEQYGEDLILYGGISGHLVELHVQDTNYNANATEQAIEKLLGGTVNYQIESPINIAVDDLFYEYKFHLYFNDMDKSAVTGEITEEDIMEMAKCWYCVNQVIDIGYWESLLIGMDVAPGDEPILTGDANFDKSVDIYDVIWISNYIIENYRFTDAQKVISDVNGDSTVDVGDAVKVAMYVLNPESNPLE